MGCVSYHITGMEKGEEKSRFLCNVTKIVAVNLSKKGAFGLKMADAFVKITILPQRKRGNTSAGD
jgi:hypothetical protein